jgi:hypothetical protein
MRGNKSEKKRACADSVRWVDGKVAPAVALLMLGDSAYAGDDLDTVELPEPSALALLAAGVAVGGAAKYVRDKRRKK